MFQVQQLALGTLLPPATETDLTSYTHAGDRVSLSTSYGGILWGELHTLPAEDRRFAAYRNRPVGSNSHSHGHRRRYNKARFVFEVQNYICTVLQVIHQIFYHIFTSASIITATVALYHHKMLLEPSSSVPSRYTLRKGVRNSPRGHPTSGRSRQDSVLRVTELKSPGRITKPKKPSKTESSKKTKQHRPRLPVAQKALLVVDQGIYELSDTYPVPQLDSPKEVIIATHTIGLNPIDWKSVAYNFCLPAFPWITGRELSGTVVAVGKSVRGLAVGDKVWTSTYYKDVRAGCFQEYVAVPAHTVLRISAGLTMEQASCLGVAGLTAAMTLWRWLGVPLPQEKFKSEKEEWLLIWGGSTITGQFATQIAVQSGLRVITVASSKTQALSQSLGASHVISRDGKSDEAIVAEIKKVTNGRVTRAIDLVGVKNVPSTLKSCSTTLPVAFAPLAMMSSEQKVPSNITAHTVEMKQFILDPSCRVYADVLNDLIADDRLQFPDIHVVEGGLGCVAEGLELLKSGNMGGRKLVVQT